MIRPALLLALVLSACGVDGPPVPPSQAREDARAPAVTISGSVGIGVGGRF